MVTKVEFLVDSRYEQQLKERESQLQKEDLSDMVAEHAAKQKVPVTINLYFVCHHKSKLICDFRCCHWKLCFYPSPRKVVIQFRVDGSEQGFQGGWG